MTPWTRDSEQPYKKGGKPNGDRQTKQSREHKRSTCREKKKKVGNNYTVQGNNNKRGTSTILYFQVLLNNVNTQNNFKEVHRQ